MDDKLFLGLTTYIILSVLVTGFIPSDLLEGDVLSQSSINSTIEQFQDSVNTTGGDFDSAPSQRSFLSKGLQFTFFTWTLAGVPAIVGIGLFLLNWYVLVICSVYIYDKIRGI